MVLGALQERLGLAQASRDPARLNDFRPQLTEFKFLIMARHDYAPVIAWAKWNALEIEIRTIGDKIGVIRNQRKSRAEVQAALGERIVLARGRLRESLGPCVKEKAGAVVTGIPAQGFSWEDGLWLFTTPEDIAELVAGVREGRDPKAREVDIRHLQAERDKVLKQQDMIETASTHWFDPSTTAGADFHYRHELLGHFRQRWSEIQRGFSEPCDVCGRSIALAPRRFRKVMAEAHRAVGIVVPDAKQASERRVTLAHKWSEGELAAVGTAPAEESETDTYKAPAVNDGPFDPEAAMERAEKPYDPQEKV